MDAQLYDENGNPTSFGKQAVVNGVPNVHYITLVVRADNTGSVTLTNVRITDTSQSGTELPPQYVNDFTIALQSPVPFASLPRSQSTQWGTGNSCITNAECGTSEVCIGSTPTCKIPINNYIGEVTFRTSFLAEWRDAFNAPQTPVSSNVALSISFLPENVIFRTNARICTDYGTSTWIAYDVNGDISLEKFGGTAGACTNFQCANPSSNPQNIQAIGNCNFYKSSETDICVCRNPTDTYPRKFTKDTGAASNAIIATAPTEPYTSQNCGGVIPCQEVYNVQVGQNATCTDGIQNQDETDIDCGGLTCGDCANGLHCLINGDCQSNICTAGICTAPAGNQTQNQTGFIKFRVPGPLNYDYAQASSCGYDATNKWMSSDYPGNYCTVNNLVGFGSYGNAPVASGNCDSYFGATNRMFQVPYTPGNPSAECELNGNGNGIVNLYDARFKLSGPRLALCETDADGVGILFAKFEEGHANAAPAILNSTPITPANEVSCG